ncbi:MAG: malate synthase A [Holophagaceae bacterium]|nr:malate synthase A [Holophagaceae bacterium]
MNPLARTETPLLQGLRWTEPRHAADARVLTPHALAFVADLARRFREDRELLLAEREERQRRFDQGFRPGFLPGTAALRDGDWTVAPLPSVLLDRRVEITGPPDRKMLINALNSGAKVHMSDFEDSLAPTPQNLLDGQANLQDAVRGVLVHEEGGRRYTLNPETAVLMVRPRGLHLEEAHLLVDGEPVPASLFDAGLFLFHNAAELGRQGKGAYLYLPKLEHYREARWWNRVLEAAERELGLEAGSVKVTVLIETLPAAFQMDEILFELKTRAAGLNLGRWDYIFSFLKVHRADPAAILPDRGRVTMDQPFLRAYARRLVQVCHRRGCLALGGMSAFVPVKADTEATEKALAQVRADKLREVQDGCDGTWVAHPGLVPIAKLVFDEGLEGPNQLGFIPGLEVPAAALLEVPDGPRTRDTLFRNLRIGIRYLEAWLGGNGCVALYGLMEDAATAEISRMQLWQWVRHGAVVEDIGPLSRCAFHGFVLDALQQIHAEVGGQAFEDGRYLEAAELFEGLILAPLPDAFLTLSAYARLAGSAPAALPLQEIA